MFDQTKKNNTSVKASKKGFIEMQGEIKELLPNNMSKVMLDNGHEIMGIMSGKMRMHKIKVMPGDHVTIELTPYDLTKGRITYRF